MVIPMYLSLPGIYAAALRALKSNPLIYLLLLLWGLSEGVVLLAILVIGGTGWISTLIAAASMKSGAGTWISIVTATYLGIALLVLGLLSAATRAAVLGFGAKIRQGRQATTLDFVRSILRFTPQLFFGGIVVGMLTCIPVLLYLWFLKFSVSGDVIDILTSGWNFSRALALLGYLWNALLLMGVLQTLIFFWIAPWDKMVVLYRIRFPEALVRSFFFVFSRRNFARVFLLVVVNALLAELALILPSPVAFVHNWPHSLWSSSLQTAFSASPNTLASLLQFVLLPFFAFSELYLLPWPDTESSIEPNQPPMVFSSVELPHSA